MFQTFGSHGPDLTCGPRLGMVVLLSQVNTTIIVMDTDLVLQPSLRYSFDVALETLWDLHATSNSYSYGL